MNIATRRLIAVGAFAVLAAAPAAVATMTTSSASEQVAGPACLAWYGNKEDGVCLGYSNGGGYTVGTPQFNYCPPGNANKDGCGWSTGPLLPGMTFEDSIGAP